MAAEFDTAEAVLDAAHKAYAAGYRRMDAYTPIPVHGLDEALGFRPTRLPWLIFLGGVTGAAGMFYFQTWINVMDYPLNIGGRPYFSWPAFIPATFEGMVLLASICAVFGLFAICGFPQPYHPMANAPHFERASSDRFFLCIEAHDGNYDTVQTRRFLESLQPLAVTEVEN
ncbi:MAG TPA: DUF3341 domain-containing protein [Roseiflexaceae bacterium]|nr:DUF3341 domain-containing protein [Roseiflexaceae bacterium]